MQVPTQDTTLHGKAIIKITNSQVIYWLDFENIYLVLLFIWNGMEELQFSTMPELRLSQHVDLYFVFMWEQ